MNTFVIRETACYEVTANSPEEALAKFLNPRGGIRAGRNIESTEVLEREVYEA